MEKHDKKTWKDKLAEIQPQKSLSAMLREINAIGVDLSYNGLKKQKEKHGILKKEDGLFFLRVDTVLRLGLWKDSSGNLVVDYSSSGSGLKKRHDIAKVRELEAKARMREREDQEQAGELINRMELAGRVLAPAVEFQRCVMAKIDKKSMEWISLVGGDDGKAHALSREVRMFIKENLAIAYADKQYRLSIDPVKPQQKSLIDG